MAALTSLARDRPYRFVLGVFVAETAVALPFVAGFKILGFDLEPLRLAIPVAQSVFMLWVVRALGWSSRAGFRRDVSSLQVYWYPVLLAFVPVIGYGTVAIPAGRFAFYAAAILFTGISEETLARGVMLPALLPRGKWVALFFAATLFSVAHLTNTIFSDPGALRMLEVLLVTFGFAVLYGAVFLRTGNLWPLIVLHTIHDLSYLISGTAGPFVARPLALSLSVGFALLNVAVGVFLTASITPMPGESHDQAPLS